MIGNILTYQGDPPTALGAPDLTKVLELFKQQNDILKAAMTTCVIIPASTQIRTIRKEEAPDDAPP